MRLFRGSLVLGLIGACGGACLGGGTTPEEPPSADGGSPEATTDVSTSKDASDATVGSDTSTPIVDAGVGALDALDASDASFDGTVFDASSDSGVDAGQETVVSVVAGYPFTCFVMSSGRLFCAGGSVSTLPTLVPGVTDAVEVAVGGAGAASSKKPFLCIRRMAGSVECWGENEYGQLGDGTLIARVAPTPVVGLIDAVQLSASPRNSICARRANGRVVCWGDNSNGNLGDGTTVARSVPTSVVGLTDAVDLSVGARGACATRNGGQVVCWGANSLGELGDGRFDHETCALSEDCSTVAVPVPALTDAVAIAHGYETAHALRADGTVWSWGGNRYGSLGDGKTSHATTCPRRPVVDCAPTPVAVTMPTPPGGGAPLAALKLGGGGHGACFVPERRDGLSPGEVYCWGWDGYGQLGNDVTQKNSHVPVGVKALADAQSISRTMDSACVMRHYGRISCWGSNWQGNLANGTTVNAPVLTDVLTPAGTVCSSDRSDKGCVFPP